MGMDLHSKGAGFSRQLLSDVEDMIRSILGGLSATVAAQKDGVPLSDQHRVLNFQGAGVSVTDDPADRRVNIFVPGAPTSSAGTTMISSTSAKALSLWNGASNNAPPANWQTNAFSDAGWGNAVAATVVATTPASTGVAGTALIWPTAAPAANTEQALIRQTFTLPAGAITSATLQMGWDEYVDGGVYINGTLVATPANQNQWDGGYSLAIPLALLTPSASNLIAIKARNQFPNNAWVSYKIVVASGSGGADPQYIPKSIIGAKGDLIAGTAAATPANVAVGTDGKVLTADSTVAPGVSWQTPAAGGMANPMTTLDDVIVGGTAGAPTRLAKGTDGQVLTVDPTSHHVAWDTLSGSTITPYVNIQDQKTSGTAGGTFTSGAWQTRTLNTTQSDTGSVSSLASNQITLPAGTYRVSIKCPAAFVNNHQARLQNITDSTTILTGTSEVAANGSGATSHMTSSEIRGKFVLAATKVLEVQHRCAVTNGTNGFGNAGSFGTEVFTVAEFWKDA